jgi:hypothetical protein
MSHPTEDIEGIQQRITNFKDGDLYQIVASVAGAGDEVGQLLQVFPQSVPILFDYTVRGW